VTNDDVVQQKIEERSEEAMPDQVKLLGVNWNREATPFLPVKLNLNLLQLKKTFCNCQYDLMNFQGPCLNRARIFMHSLQCSN
jgi:hypothetical protein